MYLFRIYEMLITKWSLHKFLLWSMVHAVMRYQATLSVCAPFANRCRGKTPLWGHLLLFNDCDCVYAVFITFNIPTNFIVGISVSVFHWEHYLLFNWMCNFKKLTCRIFCRTHFFVQRWCKCLSAPIIIIIPEHFKFTDNSALLKFAYSIIFFLY
jgi:hypothetical protein